ncbi:MAG: hypothetical protein ACRDZ7_05040 [Acidimicrobiia bacterium]
MSRELLSGLFTGLLILTGCSDDDGDEEASTETSTVGGEAEETGEATEPTGLDPTFGQNGVSASPLSPTDHDRFLGVTAGPDGTAYVTGWTSSGGDNSMVLVRLDAAGAVDKTFGEAGVAAVNVAPGGKVAEVARTVAVQSDGKVVITGPFEKNPRATGDAARDNDVAVVRFDAQGKPDPTFGEGGIARLDLGQGKATADGGYNTDNAWGLVSLPDNRVVVFGSTPAPGRDDTDVVMAALTSAGKPDTAFGTQGVLRIDKGPTIDNPRGLKLQPDGKLVATGYSRDGAGVVTPMIIRASAAGVLDDSFGEAGVATAPVLPGGVAESYQLGFQGRDYVLTGYGHGAGEEKLDMISMRFSATGDWDKTWGTDGVLRVDVAGQDDRGRNLVVLPDSRVLLIGVGSTAEDTADAMVVLVDEQGAPVTAFGTGGRVLSDLGGPADAWFGGAVTGDGKFVTIVGYQGADQEGEGDDDAAIARIAL